MSAIETIEKNLATVNQTINGALEEYGRLEKSTKLVAVTKTREPDVIEKAVDAGHRIFGENRVQEADKKWPDLKRRNPDIKLHLIGPLQTNKVPLAVKLFDVIETIDRIKLAAAISHQINVNGHQIRCFIQVNTGKENQKAGILPEKADEFISECKNDLNLPVDGLMCIPPKNEEPALHFALLREIATRNNISELSMGMSADYDTAIQFGATYVRIGTAIFGPRVV